MSDESKPAMNLSKITVTQKSGIGIGRFFQRVQQFFTKEADPHEIKLIGRIHELQVTANQVLVDLIAFKNDVEAAIDPYLFSLICNVVDPMIKEIATFQKICEHEESATVQVKTYHRYVEWLEKARKWAELKAQIHQPHIIEQATSSHIVQEFLTRIARDIKILLDYLDHTLNSFELDDTFKDILRAQITPRIEPQLHLLSNLKEAPCNVSLDALINWRYEADRQRERCFSETLHIIDAFANEFNPSKSSEVNAASEHETEILVQLALLEEQMALLAADVDGLHDGDEKGAKQLFSTLESLEADIHSLNSDLLLPPDLFDRVQQIIETLAALREKILM